jgi:hypothetical protein
MTKARVTFKTTRISDDDWNISAQMPDGQTVVITGLVNKAEADNWMNDQRHSTWLRSRGFAK